ncbi:helix-turn-helix domain-containing protein [Cuneatibacter sp. NSJ-177]|uniref:helix-turn-helix domain-containing protein n=1 Tax=Cuneatibacter sp. NSJ-177 TaxID=2931401 RepID=UPI001FD4768D|nr:helix-turn-helix transcriptional regulator [Cuneatibacter sp. NSJ-177]MCJ7836048.1 helix-turn-helix domain-containing protein [Cuneatibacter sp. NSJ-177]
MDLVKIGKYIAVKRKGLGLTQKQVAEKLGMSDKSVSKWERGVCLPDVSVYMELCDLLGIGINEFVAGEDISQENIRKKSEDNLIQVATDSKQRQKHLKRVIAVLIILAILATATIGVGIYQFIRPQNYILAVDQDSVEMKTAQLLSGVDGAFLFRYTASDQFKTLTLYISEYQSGERISKEKMVASFEDTGAPSNGMMIIVPDFEKFTVKVVLADDFSKLSTDIPILDDVQDRAYYGRSATQIEEKTEIKYEEEQGLVALIYDNDSMSVIPIQEFERGEVRSDNDYMYYFSCQFGK